MRARDEIARLIRDAGLFDRLAAFNPAWVGSTFLDVHSGASDVDICCSFLPGLAETAGAADAACGIYEAYARTEEVYGGQASRILRFRIGGQAVEVWGRAHPVKAHEFWKYTQAEARLLNLFGDPLRDTVRHLKRSGHSTEQAFGRALGRPGDAEAALLEWFSQPDALLQRLPFSCGSA